MKKILIIEDNQLTIDLLVYALQKEGYKVETALNGREAYKALKEFNPDLVTLDLMLPDMDGFDLCRDIKKKYNIPVIILSGKNDRDNRLKGLQIGADDFMIKPFYPDELLIRISNILSKQEGQGDRQGHKRIELSCGLTIDEDKIEVIDTRSGKLINLTNIEYKILLFLVSNKNFVQERASILYEIWEEDGNFNTRTVDTHIQRLRKKLGVYKECIISIRGVGYKFEDKEL
ncbi:MAG: response regulator transcription factor [Intestinibacter sp.]